MVSMFFVILALYVVATCHLNVVHAQIDYSNCVTITADKGRNADCPAGTIAVGLCTSGRYADCTSGLFTELKCCPRCVQVVKTEQKKACYTQEGSKGSQLTCLSGMVVNSVCSSGADGDCGNNVWNRINCCDSPDVNPTESCSWLTAGKGVMRECAANNVIRGVCSSGRYEDCSISGVASYTGIYCCTYN